MPSADPAHASRRWLAIVGIGEDGVDGLTPAARRLIVSAEIVFGGKRHLALAEPLIRGAVRAWPSPFDRAVEEVLAHRGRQVCVLAPRDWAHWLFLTKPQEELLAPLPAGTLDVATVREGG